MRLKILVIPSVFMFHIAGAQSGPEPVSVTQATITTQAAPASSTPVALPEAVPAAAPESASPSAEALPISLLDYKSVYEAATIEEEVKMAGERFNLTKAQQDVWMEAAAERRQTEQFAREKLDSKDPNFEKSGVYRGLRSSQTTFHETIIGYLTPSQKQALENDRLILQAKQKKLAKMPPAPPTPTVTIAPVDSAAIKKDEKAKKPAKKSKKKKKAVSQ